MAGWIKMPLGMEVGLGPGDFVLDGYPAPPHKFRPMLWPNGWMDGYMPLATKVGLGLGRIALHGDPALPSQKGHSARFSANVYCGQTVAHLSY